MCSCVPPPHRSELDGSSVASMEKYPEPFLVGLELEVEEGEPLTSPSPSWQNLPHPHATPLPCFATRQEELMVGNIFSQFDCQSVRQAEEDAAVQTQTYRSIVHSCHGNHSPSGVADPLVLLGDGDSVHPAEARGSLFSNLARSEDPAHSYVPYGENEDDSSSSSDEEEEEGKAMGWEGIGDIPHNLLLDPVDPPTGDLVNLGDSVEEAVQPQAEVPTEPSSSVGVGAAEVVSNSGFLDDGDILGLGIASSSTTQGQPFDPFTGSSAQQLQGGTAFGILSPTPMKPSSAPPTQPQTAADPDFMTFANPAAFGDLGTQLHSQSKASSFVQTQFVSQPRPDPFAGLTSLGTQLPSSGCPRPQPTDATRMKANPLPRGQPKPVVGEGSRSHGSYSSVIGRRDERGTRFHGGKICTVSCPL